MTFNFTVPTLPLIVYTTILCKYLNFYSEIFFKPVLMNTGCDLLYEILILKVQRGKKTIISSSLAVLQI